MWPALIAAAGSILGQPENVTTNGTSTSRKNISKEGFDKIVSDILSSDQGLAQLATGENLSGGYGSTTKAQLAQDLVTKLAGELANVTAETVTTQNSNTDNDSVLESMGSKFKVGEAFNIARGGRADPLGNLVSGKKATVICTELVRQGLLDKELYDAGAAHFLGLPTRTIIGYTCWAKKVIPVMQRSRQLSNFLLPIAVARYNHITGRKRNVIGFLTVHIAQPICYVIGYIVEVLYGYRILSNT